MRKRLSELELNKYYFSCSFNAFNPGLMFIVKVIKIEENNGVLLRFEDRSKGWFKIDGNFKYIEVDKVTLAFYGLR